MNTRRSFLASSLVLMASPALASSGAVANIEMEQFTIGFVQNARSRGTMLLRVRLVPKDAETAQLITKALPRVRDGFQRYLIDYAERRPPHMLEIDLDTLSRGLERSLASTLSKPDTARILFRQAQFTPAR